jgi:hypothetical protein
VCLTEEPFINVWKNKETVCMGSLWSDVKEQVAVAATSDFPQPA